VIIIQRPQYAYAIGYERDTAAIRTVTCVRLDEQMRLARCATRA